MHLNKIGQLPTDAWFEDRFDLFSRVTLPSISSQVDKRWAWLLLCDAATPGWVLATLRHLVRDMPAQIEVIAVPFDGVCLAAALRSRVRDGELLITTRLDTDDGIARRFTADVRAVASQHVNCVGDGFFINFPLGTQATLDGCIYSCVDFANPFLSFVERVDSSRALRGVHCAKHPRAISAGRVVQIERPPRWVQLIHRNNIANELYGSRSPRQTFEVEFSTLL